MRTIIWSTFLALLLCTSAPSQSTQAAMAASPHKVKQGEQVTIQVKVNPAPNVPGRVDVWVAQEGSTSLNNNGGNGVSPGQTSVGEIGITVPVDAKLGAWKVIKVSFQPPGSSQRELAISGDTIFEVVKREAVFPTSADVQVK
jgi:hypothetical protein